MPDMFLDTSSHGIFADHPERADLPVLAAPTQTDEFNTIRYPLVAVACAQLPDDKFDFDSSFIVAGVIDSMSKLAQLVRKNPGCPLSLFGHADPVGNDDYNKKLSGRRAAAVYGMLIRNVDIWEDISQNTGQFAAALPSDVWGTKSIQVMLDTLGYPPGRTDGQMDSDTRQAVKDFQTENPGADDAPLKPDGDPGPKTRKALYKAYMNHICTDEHNKPFVLQKEDFLARGLDPKGKADYQGCSDFNPLLLFSQEEEKEFSKPENKDARNQANRVNRRVLAYLFRKGSKVDPARWPCPRAKEGSGDCRKRFWSDGDARRSKHLPDARRHFSETEDTFACRYYHGFAANSPCEDTVKIWAIRLQTAGPDGTRVPFAKRAFVVSVGEAEDAAVIRGTTDDNGILNIPVFDETAVMTLKIDAWNVLANTPAAGGAGSSGADSAPASSPGSSTGAASGASAPASGDSGAGASSKLDGAASPDETPEGEDSSTGTAGQPNADAEAKFLTLTLRAGNLKKIEDGDEAAKQRLYNLGFGMGDYAQWDKTAYSRYMTAFQRSNNLSDQSGTLTPETQDKLKTMHGG